VAEKRQENGELSLISIGAVIEGKLKTDGSVRVDGKLVGDIIAKSNAAVGPSGTVEGSLTAKNVSLAGKVQGSIVASDKLILEAKCIMQGDIRAARLVVDEGAMFDGKCAMTGGLAPAGKESPKGI
jgi:cytoskeletal protein CcmA (bactofilin family)